MPGAIYGVLLGLTMFVLFRVAPQPAGSVSFWCALSVQTAMASWIVWRRLRLPWFRVSGVAAFGASVAMIPISARGLDLVTMAAALPIGVVVAIWVAVLSVPVGIGLESLRNSDDWQAWRARAAKSSVWDILMFRHVPDPHRLSEASTID